MCEKQRKMSERSSLFPILYSFRVYIFIDLPKAVKHHSVREITAESRYHRAEIRAVRETERNPSIYKNPAERILRESAYSSPFESPASPCAVLRTFARYPLFQRVMRFSSQGIFARKFGTSKVRPLFVTESCERSATEVHSAAL